jgi:cysteine-rich repeat protein
MPTSHRRSLALALCAATLLPAAAGGLASGAETPIAGKKLSLGGEAGAKSARFKFQSEKDQAPLAALPDPTAGFELLVRGTGAGAGRSELVRIEPDAGLWKLLGKPTSPKGWQYKDKTGSRGGLRKVRIEKGGLSIEAKGTGWSFVPAGPQGSVQVAVGIGTESFCAEFGGDVKKDEPGRFDAKKAPAPAACELEVCGNGSLDAGETCDDGNLVDDDGCSNTCCAGEAFASTFAAIHDAVVVGYGCTEGFCHGDVDPPGGELVLLPDVAYANLVGVDSVGIPGTLRVAPGDADASFLYDKLAAATNGTSPAFGQPMPLSGGALSTDELAAVRLWIEGGAPEAGTVAETGELLGVCLP